MNLSYEARVELLEIVTKVHEEHWHTIIDIDKRFRDDDNMINDKKAYWAKKQDEAYERKQLLDDIKTQLTLSL